MKFSAGTTRDHDWVREYAGSITVCDSKGIILEMNDQAIKDNREQGGKALIGTNLLDCHPEPARTKLVELLKSRHTNVYTIEKNGKKRLVHQTPWRRNGRYQGFIELELEIPDTMPHFVRD